MTPFDGLSTRTELCSSLFSCRFQIQIHLKMINNNNYIDLSFRVRTWCIRRDGFRLFLFTVVSFYFYRLYKRDGCELGFRFFKFTGSVPFFLQTGDFRPSWMVCPDGIKDESSRIEKEMGTYIRYTIVRLRYTKNK